MKKLLEKAIKKQKQSKDLKQNEKKLKKTQKKA
jgi:hypothetical protein